MTYQRTIEGLWLQYSYDGSIPSMVALRVQDHIKDYGGLDMPWYRVCSTLKAMVAAGYDPHAVQSSDEVIGHTAQLHCATEARYRGI